MASKINKVLTNQTQTFSNEELANVSASLSAILGQGGGASCASAWLPTVTEDGDISWILTSATTAPATANIMGPAGPSGAKGEQGPSGTNGKDAPIPEFRINSSNTHWEWKYTSASNWTDLNVVASGTVGPQGVQGPSGAKGDTGAKGADATPLTATTATIAGGTQVTISYTSGGDPLAQFNVLSGAKGADGQNGQNGAPGVDGISPTFTTSVTSDAQHPQSGTHVVISGAAGESAFNVWNGVDGTGATVNVFGNNGVSVTKDGTNYTVGLSGGYYSDTLSAYSALYAGYASNAKFSDNSVSSMDQIKGSIDDGNQVAYVTSANLYNASAKWDAVSAKSHTTIDGNQVITTESNGTSATVSAVQYVTNDGFATAPKQLFVCQDDNDLTAHLSICNGKGTLFFVCSAIA